MTFYDNVIPSKVAMQQPRRTCQRTAATISPPRSAAARPSPCCDSAPAGRPPARHLLNSCSGALPLWTITTRGLMLAASAYIHVPLRASTNAVATHQTVPHLQTPRCVMSPPRPLRARRWVARSYGDVTNLQLEEATLPPPAASEVRVHVRAIGLNFADVFTVLGLYGAAGPPPQTPGFEVCGVVESAGEGVTQFKAGDRVSALPRFGGYATAICVPAAMVRPLPEGWSFVEGAAFPAQAFTAWYALCVLGGLPLRADGGTRQITSRRRAVLVHSAAGGVGLHLVEMVKRAGGVAVCTVGNEEKAGLLRERCGVPRERVVVRGVDDVGGFEQVVRERALGGEGGVDVVVDSVLGEYFAPGYKLLNPGGRYVVMGTASIVPNGGVNLLKVSGWWNLMLLGWRFVQRPKLDVAATINHNKSVAGFNLGYLFQEEELVRQGFKEVEQMGLPKPLIGRKFAFEEAREALQFFQSGNSMGKLVLLVE